MKRRRQTIKLTLHWEGDVAFRVQLVRKAPMARSVREGSDAFIYAFAREFWRDAAIVMR
jgi:hypothetical protein